MPTPFNLSCGMRFPPACQQDLGRTGIFVPPIIFGTSYPVNLREVVPAETIRRRFWCALKDEGLVIPEFPLGG